MPPTHTGLAVSQVRACLGHYGLHDFPFSRGAASPTAWLAPARASVLAAVGAAIRTGDGVVVVTGEAGIGKTWLLERLMETLPRESPVAAGRLPRSVFEVSELPHLVADAFGLPDQPSSAAFAARFRRFLADARSGGDAVLLAIDDAHNLGDDVLAKLFDLSMIGHFEEHPLAMLLVGQPELDDTLGKAEHAALRQRVVLGCALQALSLDDVGRYVELRLREGGAQAPIFDGEAIREIWRISRGAPGVVNVVCQQALLFGCQRGARTIGRDIVADCLGTVASVRASGSPDAGGSDIAPRAPSEPALGAVADSDGTRSRDRRRARRLVTAGGTALIPLVIAVVAMRGDTSYLARSEETLARTADTPALAEHGAREDTAAAAAVPSSTDGTRPGGSAPPAATGDRFDAPQPSARVERPRRGTPPAPNPAPRAPDSDIGTRRADAPRGGSTSRPPARDAGDAADPGAVIDWLLRESRSR